MTCDMVEGCKKPISHIDINGFIYCESHGFLRKSYMRCRKLTKEEIKTIKLGKPIKKY